MTLQEQLLIFDRKYYSGSPMISNREYDRLREILPAQAVTERPISGFSKIIHDVPMLSLRHSYDDDELRRFLRKIGDVGYVVEPKIDGMALSLRYDGGRLICASSRGDGRAGSDITDTARRIGTIRQFIGYLNPIEIRGEVFVPSELKGEYADARSAAASIMFMKHPSALKVETLRFIAYQIVGSKESQWESLKHLSRIGFATDEHSIRINTVQEAMKAARSIWNRHDAYGYDCDGAVIKVDSADHRDRIGYSPRAPKWCIAYKW